MLSIAYQLRALQKSAMAQLETGRQSIQAGEREASVLLNRMKELIQSVSSAVIDYVAIVDADSLKPVTRLEGTIMLALAVKFGQTRLIDNLKLSIPRS